MTSQLLYPRIQRQIRAAERELRAAVRRAAREHDSVRDAAAALGMPKSTFFDVLNGARRG